MSSSLHLLAGAGSGVAGGMESNRIDVHDVSVMMMAASRATTPMGGPSRVRLPGQVGAGVLITNTRDVEQLSSLEQRSSCATHFYQHRDFLCRS